MSAKKSLGRGIASLIPTDLDENLYKEDEKRVQNLLIQDIVPNPTQPRREMDLDSLGELTESIKHHGVLQPILVVKQKKGFRIVAGERRWRAAKAAGLVDIPAVVRSLAELEQVELALIENIQRVDLSPLEQAISVLKLQQQFNLKLEEIAQKLGKAPSTVSNLARLLELPDSATLALQTGRISEGHARAILSLKGNDSKQQELLQSILDNNLTVRQAENFATNAKKSGSKKISVTFSPATAQAAKELSTKLGYKVSIRSSGRGGSLNIRFKSEKELKKLLSRLDTK